MTERRPHTPKRYSDDEARPRPKYLYQTPDSLLLFRSRLIDVYIIAGIGGGVALSLSLLALVAVPTPDQQQPFRPQEISTPTPLASIAPIGG